MTDPWAAAAMPPATQQASASSPVDDGTSGTSALAGAYAPADAGPSLLFGGGSLAPSLFNKTHGLNVWRYGVISKPPYNQQSRDFNTKQPKFWSASKENGKATTTNAVDPITRQQNRPVIDVLVEMTTEYTMDKNEAVAVGRDPNSIGDDDGKRVFAVSGKESMDAFKKAIGEAIAAGVTITGDKDLEGLKFAARRIGQKPNPGGNPSWLWEIKLAAQ